MKVKGCIKAFLGLLFGISLSANAAIIDFVIDVKDEIYDPVGMTWDGNYLWVVDDETAFELHQIDPVTGEVVSKFAVNPANTATPDPESVTWDGSHLWVMDSIGVIGKYTTDGSLVDTVMTNGGELDGLTWHDGTFWITNKTSGEIFQIDEQGADIQNFYTGLTEIDSIDIYNGSIWVGDDGSDSIFQYDLATFELLDVINLEDLLIDAGLDITFNDPKGLTWDDSGNLWFSDDGDEVLVRIDYDAVSVPEPPTMALFALMFLLISQRRYLFGKS